MTEKEQYGTIKSAQPIRVPTRGDGGVYIVSTPNVTTPPDPRVQHVVEANVSRDLAALRRSGRIDGS
jgi:hypothetical protein